MTWKADGTRYMLILLRWGTYLVDRKFFITRVQMRWPTPLDPSKRGKGPVGPMHHWVNGKKAAAPEHQGPCFVPHPRSALAPHG